jgi:hypothetical protein
MAVGPMVIRVEPISEPVAIEPMFDDHCCLLLLQQNNYYYVQKIKRRLIGQNSSIVSRLYFSKDRLRTLGSEKFPVIPEEPRAISKHHDYELDVSLDWKSNDIMIKELSPFYFISSEANVANLFAKPLPVPKYRKLLGLNDEEGVQIINYLYSHRQKSPTSRLAPAKMRKMRKIKNMD